jgi:hypothetical protein
MCALFILCMTICYFDKFLTCQAGIRSQAGFVVDNLVLGQAFFSRSTSVFRCQYHSVSVLYRYISFIYHWRCVVLVAGKTLLTEKFCGLFVNYSCGTLPVDLCHNEMHTVLDLHILWYIWSVQSLVWIGGQICFTSLLCLHVLTSLNCLMHK